MKNRIGFALLCAGTALVAGCAKKAPSGQVAAKVNGKEVTLQEINTELQASNIPASADKQTVQRALLQRVIERKLLMGAAEEKGLDKTPEYLAQKRRGEELLLIQSYARQQLSAIPVPTQAQIDKFLTDNPTAFAHREQLVLDQIRFATPPNPSTLSTLKDVHSMDGVAAQLTKLGVRFERGSSGLDTAAAPPALIKQIESLPATEPFVVPQPGIITINVIKDRKPVPFDAVAARPAAVAAWRQQRFNEALTSQLNALKGSAKISYQNGFGPPAAPKGPPGAPGAAAPGGCAGPALSASLTRQKGPAPIWRPGLFCLGGRGRGRAVSGARKVADGGANARRRGRWARPQ